MTAQRNSISPTIKDQVYAILKEEICNGIHADGQRLHENELATRLKVSRSPVREALRQLASDGLVLELPNKGAFVKELTTSDIDDIFEIRLLLECYGIRRSAEHLTDEIRANLRKYHDGLIRFHAASNLPEYMAVDGRLHSTLIQISGNALAQSVYGKISSLALKFRVTSLLGKQRFDESVEEHCSIINSILEGDPVAAMAMNERHLQRAKHKVIDHIISQKEAKTFRTC